MFEHKIAVKFRAYCVFHDPKKGKIGSEKITMSPVSFPLAAHVFETLWPNEEG